ncbi:MAG: DUF2065 domain-containing protein, partial [Desulfatibacillaceae bacterium]|nr:DUF2065 domain-containing protein [Desulfatibacillaceae bacterium]
YFVLCVIGLVMIIEGMPYFLFPDKLKTVFVQMLQTPDKSLRVMGFVLMALGLLLVYLGRR